MFKREKVTEDELLLSMEKNLRTNAFIEDTQKTEERIQAMQLLQKAAHNFEIVGKTNEAEAVTRIIEFVATKKAEDMTPKQQVKNLEETGTQFPKSMFDGDPQDEEDLLYEEYMSDPEISEEVKVSEAREDHLSDHELVALKRLWE